MSNPSSNKTQIIIATIGAIATLGTALIAILPNLTNDAPNTVNAISPESQKVFHLAAIIDDKDGYTNIRSLASKEGQIVDTIQAGEIFNTYHQKGNWWLVKSPRNKVGYMHLSRIKLLK